MKIGVIGAGMIGSTVGKLWVLPARDVVRSRARVGKEFEPGTKPYNTGMSGPQVRKVLEVP